MSTIICPGPSSVHVTDGDCMGRVVAVNKAVNLSSIFGGPLWSISTWAMMDVPPLNGSHLDWPGDVWYPKSNTRSWAAYESAAHHPIETRLRLASDAQRNHWIYKDPFLWFGHYTTLFAIAGCILRGAKQIRILGADMCGEGYMRDWKNTSDTTGRWDRERVLLEQCVALAADNGVTIDVVDLTGRQNEGTSARG